MIESELNRLRRKNAELTRVLKQVVRCLENWVEIADEEDLRDYDTKAIQAARQLIVKQEGA